MHRLLSHQIDKATSAPGRIELAQLLTMIDQAYEESDKDRRRTDHAITLMVDEVNQLNEELRENQEQRFLAAIDNMAQGLSMFDADFNLIVCNGAYVELYGLPEHLTRAGTSFWEIIKSRAERGFVSNASKDQLHKELLELTARRTAFRGPVTMINGRVLMLNHQPMNDGGWLSTHEDITEQRRREDLMAERSHELYQQNMRFDAAVNNMTQGLSLFDADRRLVICNEPYRRLYDLPEELAAPGTSFWAMLDHGAQSGMVSIADAGERRRVLDKIIQAGVASRDIVRMVNGRVMSVSHQPLPDGGWLATHEDITESHRKEEVIRHMARHDSLTDLPNRTAFVERIAAAELAIADGETAALYVIDLDRFKSVNDTYGHAAGDALLLVAAKRLRKLTARGGFAARLGGDEFAILRSPAPTQASAAAFGQKIVRAFAAPFPISKGIEMSVGASVGIAMAPRDGRDGDTLITNADLALYQAKSEGKGRWRQFDADLHAAHERRRAIETRLKNALPEGELSLAFQPLISLETGRIVAFEALMRWTNPTLGTVSPAEFIPAAEDLGLIQAMGEWALQKACAEAAGWPGDIRVAVNVSPAQFADQKLTSQIESALTRSGLSPDRLELEITESLFLGDNRHNLEILQAAHLLGARIALDDFGTGYSSLSYLRSFPFDKIKIDGSFISDLGTGPDSLAIVHAVVGLARSLGMSTTAEGIETEAQLDIVRAQGCSEAQGFLFSPALPASSIAELLRTQGWRPGAPERSMNRPAATKSASG